MKLIKSAIKMMFLCSILFVFPTSVSALICPYTKQARLKSIASNIKVDYNYEETQDSVTF